MTEGDNFLNGLKEFLNSLLDLIDMKIPIQVANV